MKKTTQSPTTAELAILRVLWEHGPTTVRDVHEELHPGNQGGGYTGTLKMMQLMHQKGLLHRDESARAHIYAPTVDKSGVQKEVVGDLLQRLFDGSRSQLVLQALGDTNATTPEELQEIRDLIAQFEKRVGNPDKDE